MDKITNNIYIGSSADAMHRKGQLHKAGITAILNVARDLTNTTTTYKEFKLYQVGIMDGGGNHNGLCRGAVVTLGALLDAGEKVLVHCHEGVSRSPATVAAYLAFYTREFESFDEAEEFIKSKRPRVSIKDEVKRSFMSACYLYRHSLKRKSEE